MTLGTDDSGVGGLGNMSFGCTGPDRLKLYFNRGQEGHRWAQYPTSYRCGVWLRGPYSGGLYARPGNGIFPLPYIWVLQLKDKTAGATRG